MTHCPCSKDSMAYHTNNGPNQTQMTLSVFSAAFTTLGSNKSLSVPRGLIPLICQRHMRQAYA